MAAIRKIGLCKTTELRNSSTPRRTSSRRFSFCPRARAGNLFAWAFPCNNSSRCSSVSAEKNRALPQLPCPPLATRHSPRKLFWALIHQCAARVTALFAWEKIIWSRLRKEQLLVRKIGNAHVVSPKLHKRCATSCANISRRFVSLKVYFSRKI